MKFRSAFIAVTLLHLLTSMSHASANKGWQTLCSDNRFCFDYPPSLLPTNQVSIDSTAGHLQNDFIELYYDYGLNAYDFRELKDAQESELTINGVTAKRYVTDHISALHFAEVKFVPVMNNHLKFSIELRFKGQVDLQLAQRIFQSVTLPAKK